MSIDSEDVATRDGAQPQLSLSTAAARNLATTTKTVPQNEEITSRWLLRMLPWVQVSGGTYRVNRRRTFAVGSGRVAFVQDGAEVRVIPPSLAELPLLRGFGDASVLAALADQFTPRAFEAGETIAEAGQPVDQLLLIVHGKATKIGPGRYDDPTVLGVVADGDHLDGSLLITPEATWPYSLRAETGGILLALPRPAFDAAVERSEALRRQVERFREARRQPQNRRGEAAVELAAGHGGEPTLPATFVDYELAPREYQLSVAQTILRIHTRVADLYNDPMDQTEQQLRLTVEVLRERQEHELVNNPDFGLLHMADYDQRIQAHHGPPTPDDLDELLSRRRSSRLFLAHPRAIAAFGRECSRRGLYPTPVEVQGSMVPAWRGVPILPCNKIPIADDRTTSILVMRTGEQDQGVVGLHQTGIPDEYQPSLSVRFMGINDQALISYLVSAYYSVAVLVPDALGVLENVEIARPRE